MSSQYQQNSHNHRPHYNYPIVDLHCDLLLYLATADDRTPHDACVGCGFEHLKAGGVKLQVMAHFAPTQSDSVQQGMQQAKAYQKLLSDNDKDCFAFESATSSQVFEQNRLALLWAVENASTICAEEEELSQGFGRLENLIAQQSAPLYLSLTWNMENRFGGGAHTTVGLKEDGKRLLEFMFANQIALDFSHASDQLAYESLAFLDQERLQLPVLASHSNFRTITDIARNLPDDLAKEILSRRGVIGLNVIRPFVGKDIHTKMPEHLIHALALGAHDHIAFGADFFYESDLPVDLRSCSDGYFFEGFSTAASYPQLLELCQEKVQFSDVFARRLSSGNALAFILRHSLQK